MSGLARQSLLLCLVGLAAAAGWELSLLWFHLVHRSVLLLMTLVLLCRLLLLLDRSVIALCGAAGVVDCAPPCNRSTLIVRGGRCKLMLWLLLELVLLGLLQRACGRSVILEPRRVGSIVAVIAGKICLLVRATPALVGCVVVRATDLAKWSGAWVGFAAEHGRGHVPIVTALVQAGMFGCCGEVDVGCC